METPISYFASWIYFFIGFLFLNFINRSNAETARKYGQMSFLVVYIFAIMRYEIGYDYPAYWDFVSGEAEWREFELFSGAIIDLVRFIGFPPLVFIIFSTISLLSYKYLIDHYSDNPSLSWYFYFSFPLFFFQDCSTIRQAGAMGFFFLAYSFIDKRDYIRGILFAIMSVLCHNSGLISILLLFLPLIERVSWKLNVVAFVVSFFVGKFLEIVVYNYLSGFAFAEKFISYLEGESTGFNMFQYILYLINIANLFFYKQLVIDRPKNASFVILVNVGLCLYNFFVIEPTTAIRLSTFFLMFEILLIPSYRNILEYRLSSVAISNVMLFSLMFTLQLVMVILYINGFNSGIMERAAYAPYKIWLNHL